MPDDSAPAQNPNDLQIEMERSRESAARLMDSLARKVGAPRAVMGVRGAAQYLQTHGVKRVAAGIDEIVRSRPVFSMAVAAAAGFLVGRALLPKGDFRLARR